MWATVSYDCLSIVNIHGYHIILLLSLLADVTVTSSFKNVGQCDVKFILNLE